MTGHTPDWTVISVFKRQGALGKMVAFYIIARGHACSVDQTFESSDEGNFPKFVTVKLSNRRSVFLVYRSKRSMMSDSYSRSDMFHIHQKYDWFHQTPILFDRARPFTL